MSDIYATPESDLAQVSRSEHGGGNIEDAIAGNIEVKMLETFGEAWRGLKGFKLQCLIATLLWFVIYMIAAFINMPILMGLMALGADENTAIIISGVIQFLAVTATMPMMVGITIMGVRHSQGKSVSPGSVFNYFHRVPGALLWYILMSVLIFIGFLLLVLPGIYLCFAYMFSLPLMIEKDIGAWQALEISRKAVTRLWFRATGFLLLIMLLVSLGIVLLVVPLIWILPWVSLAYAILYFKLFGAESETLAD